MKENNIKTVFRYDFGRTGFKKATYFLLILAGILFLFGFYWINSFLGT
ncbi:MAG: hypothetical protein VYD20_05325 [Candidatus Neomarinimicrobiota bacterium]|nr:hypothetical protein [Candidatus Neomarinimicrobiota bacterium]MEC9106225.1 hypothetical protein [Candidatus Neomarinimicrobiota bacterium]